MNIKKIMSLADTYAAMSERVVGSTGDALLYWSGKQGEARAALEAALSAKHGEQDALLDSTVPPHALYYPLSDYHRAPAEGPLNFTWIDKPHRLLYDLIAAVKFYANPAPSVNAQERISELEAQNAQMLEALQKVSDWAKAYPLSAFPEPDFKKAHKVLTANGMTLDAISASNMRHVITQVQGIVDAAIAAAEGKV